MAFRFNFNLEENDVDKDIKTEGDSPPGNHFKTVTVAKAEEVYYDETSQILDGLTTDSLTTCEGCVVKHYCAEEIQKRICEQNTDSVIATANSTHSDLIPHVYEGGLKVWECSLDLTHYLSGLSLAFRGLQVLELGCGAGIPGLYAYCQGALVDFQDYNKEVLQYITIPNVVLNTGLDCKDQNKCKFYAGDWSNVLELLKSLGKKYDIILTSETIYSVDSQQSLLDCLQGLVKNDGIIYVAAKSYYFGVGGSTQQFQDLVSRQGVLECKVVKTFSDGVQREILQLNPKR